MAQLHKFEGKLYKEVDEVLPGECIACAFAIEVGACQKFHRLYPSVSCSGEGSIFIEHKEKVNAPS